MNDKDFLAFIHNRLEVVYDESPRLDYMRRLRAIIETIDIEQRTFVTNPDLGASLRNPKHVIEDVL